MGVVWATLLSLVLVSYGISGKGFTEFDVTRYGAKGDGKTNDAPAFLKAWREACSSKQNFPVLLIPGKKIFVLSAVEFKGPCNAPSVGVLVLGNVISSTKKEQWRVCNDWISFRDITNLVVRGSGVFDGNGQKWWNDELSCGERPTNLAFNRCTNVSVSGIHSKNSARNHMSISRCTGAIISDITITAPEESPNTDGIDIASSTYVTVTNSHIGSGDDCIAINNHCNNITITNIKCGPGHGISVGSLGRHGEVAQVENILVRNCTLIGTTNGARIKTWKDGRGYARKIIFEDIRLINVRRPIIINQSYVDRHRPNSDDETSVAISDVKFINFRGTCEKTDAITLGCSTSGPGCENIEIKNVLIRSSSGDPLKAMCQNAQVKSLRTWPHISCWHSGHSNSIMTSDPYFDWN